MSEVGTAPTRAQRKDRAAGAWTNLVEEADDGGEGTVEPVVNVYTKLKDNKRCTSCALWGRRRFFGDWEWREAKPRCKKCVKDSEKAKDAAKFGKRADFISMNRTASGARGDVASDFGDGARVRAVRANSAQARASDASRRPRSVAALRERRLSAGSANATNAGFGDDDDDDDDDDATTTSPPISGFAGFAKTSPRFSDGKRFSSVARGTRGGGARRGAVSASKSRSPSVSPGGDDWAGAYLSRRGERGYDPAAEARALEAALPTRAQRVLERAAILAGGGDGAFRPTSTMSDAGPRGGRALARRFGNGTRAREPSRTAVNLFSQKDEARDASALDATLTNDDEDEDEPFVSRVPEVRRSTLYPGAGYVPVRERLSSGGAGASTSGAFSAGRRLSAFASSTLNAHRRAAESAPVTPLYRRGGEPHSLTGGLGGTKEPSIGFRPETETVTTPRADRVSASGPKGEKRPASYVAGLMGKSGFQTSPERAAYGQSVLEPSRAAGPRGAASPFAEVSSRTPRATSHLDARMGSVPGSRPNAGRMSAADLDRALFASRETLSATPEKTVLKSRVSKPSQELDARLSMYAPSRSSGTRTKTLLGKSESSESRQGVARTARGALGVADLSKTVHKNPHSPRGSRLVGSGDELFDELRPTPDHAATRAFGGGSAVSTPFDAVPSAFEALALREANAAETDATESEGSEGSEGSGKSPASRETAAAALASSPGSGLWYGSSASTPGRAFRAILDACRLAEEDAFAYKNLRSGRFVLDPDGAAARAYLRRFVRDAHAKGATPDWWTEAHSATLERRALDPADELGLDFAEHIGAPSGATRDELVRRWGVAGTEALRDFHFDVRPEPWEVGREEEGDDDVAEPTEGEIRVADAEAARALALPEEPRDGADGAEPAHAVCVVAPGSSLARADPADPAGAAAKDSLRYGQTVVGLPDWEEADAATRGVVVALREAGAACAPLGFFNGAHDETDAETDALDLRGKKAVVFLGVGGEERDSAVPRDRDSTDSSSDVGFDGDGCRLVGASAARVDALRAFVEAGGTFVVNGSGEHAERAFAWFGLPWRFAGERARGEYEPNVEACDAVFGEHLRLVSEKEQTRGSRGSATLRAWARGERGFYAVAGFDGVVHVTPAQRVFTRVGDSALSQEKKPDGSLANVRDPCPLAAARFGLGLVVFAGDGGGGDATCELIASLACSPPGETREYPGR